MTAAMITQLLLMFGPGAIQLIEQLINLWNKPQLTVDEALAITKIAGTSYDQYIKNAGGVPISTSPSIPLR
jgi:hypothetical protein